MAIILNDDNFEKEVIQSDLPVLVDFYADWCGTSKTMAPVVDRLASEFEGKVKVGKLNIEKAQEIVAEFRIMSIPTLIYFKNGRPTQTMVGVVAKQKLNDILSQN